MVQSKGSNSNSKIKMKKTGKKNLNRIISLVLVIVTVLSGISYGEIGVEAKSVSIYGYDQSGKWAYKILDEAKKTVSIRPSTLEYELENKVVIPSSITIENSKYTVTEIAPYAYTACACEKCIKAMNIKLETRWSLGVQYYIPGHAKSLKKVEVPATVTTIEEYAFSNNRQLTEVIFAPGSQLKNINGAAFFLDYALKDIVIPETVNYIGVYTFNETGLKEITFKQKKPFNIEQTGFLDVPITKINVENYDIYKSFYDNWGFGIWNIPQVYISSERTAVFINGEKKGEEYVGSSNSKTISISEFLLSKKGYHYEAVNGKYCEGYYTGCYDDNYREIKKELTISDNKCTIKKYPYIEINAKQVENYYIIENPGYELISSMETRKEQNGQWSTFREEQTGDYHIAYLDGITFNEYPSDEKYKKIGYYINGYKVKGTTSVYKKGSKVSKLTDAHKQKLEFELFYSPNKYNVIYSRNASGVDTDFIEDEKCEYDKYFTISTEIPERKGYKFKGWCTNKYGTGELYQPGEKVKNLTEKDGVTVSLYAIWEAGLLDMNFDANGGTVPYSSIQVAFESTVGKSLPVPEREGYNFTGWTLGRNGGTTVDSSYVVNFLMDFTVYAQWKEKEYKVTFDGNGGQVPQGVKTVYYDQSIGLLPKAERDGYKFDGWYTTRDGGNKISATTKVQKNVTYYAHWTQKTKRIKIKVKAPGGRKVSGYQVSYTKNGVEVFNNTFATSAMSTLPLTINGAKDGDVYVITARCYVMKKGKKKWSKAKIVTVTVGN